MRAFDVRTTSDREARIVDRLRERRAADPRAVLRSEVPTFPLKVQIQTHTRCNAACTMCPYPEITSEPGFDHERMPEPLYRRILEQLRGRGVERLSLFLMNEPLLDRRMTDWLALAREALPDVTLGLFTNGSALTASLAEQLASAGLDELCVSVQGFEPGSYERVMGGLRYDRLERNLNEVFAAFEQDRLGGLRLQIVMGDVPEVRATLDRANPAFRDHVLLKAFSNEREVVGVERGLGSSEARARAEAGTALCQRPFVKLYVLANGDCVLCNVDWRRSVVLGRIGEAEDGTTIEEIWNGSRYAEVREEHLRGAFPSSSICERCDYARVIDDE